MLSQSAQPIQAPRMAEATASARTVQLIHSAPEPEVASHEPCHAAAAARDTAESRSLIFQGTLALSRATASPLGPPLPRRGIRWRVPAARCCAKTRADEGVLVREVREVPPRSELPEEYANTARSTYSPREYSMRDWDIAPTYVRRM